MLPVLRSWGARGLGKNNFVEWWPCPIAYCHGLNLRWLRRSLLPPQQQIHSFMIVEYTLSYVPSATCKLGLACGVEHSCLPDQPLNCCCLMHWWAETIEQLTCHPWNPGDTSVKVIKAETYVTFVSKLALLPVWSPLQQSSGDPEDDVFSWECVSKLGLATTGIWPILWVPSDPPTGECRKLPIQDHLCTHKFSMSTSPPSSKSPHLRWHRS